MYKLFKPAGPLGPVFFRRQTKARRVARPGQESRGRLARLQPSAGAALMAALLPFSAVWAQQALLPTTQFEISGIQIQAEIAATDAARSLGLMNRHSLPDDHGMLFVFDQVGTPCFWMKNTPLPLSIAFIDTQGKITNIADMQPHSLDAHCPAAPIQYALEMEQGWFIRHQIGAGATVKNLP